MTSVGCWLSECKWCEHGWCQCGAITIGEDKECENFEHYKDDYNDSFWKACLDEGKAVRKLCCHGKKIEYNGYTFYTEDKICTGDYYCLTEERTGVNAGEFYKLKDQHRWELFLERVGTYPDVLSLPIKERSEQ